MNLPAYVLITPARNEAEFIERTISSVIAQTTRPLRWVIVSDGSTDGTDEIVERYSAAHPWIELVRMPPRAGRDFAGKVHAFSAGYARVAGLDFEAVGNLDGDVSFDEDYFPFLLRKMNQDPALGVAGSAFRDPERVLYDYRFVNIEHVTGTVQLFRRECFEQVGGYVPSKAGAVDSIAVLTARMKGWKTRTFPEKICFHHRSFGTAEHGVLMARFKNGVKDYAVGNHPLWELSRLLYQTTRRPFVAGAVMVGAGYFSAMLRRMPRPVSDELVAFNRREQMRRLRHAFTRLFRPARPAEIR